MALFLRALLLWLICGALAKANPMLLKTDSYIASEHLEIRLNRDAAELRGAFTFQKTGDSDDLPPAVPWVLELPVWFPLQNASNPAVARFWRAPQKEGALRESINLLIRAGKRTISPTSLIVSQNDIPSAWKHPGFSCLRFDYPVKTSEIEHSAPVTISYRQPYSVQGTETTFFYVPLFKNLPRITALETSGSYSVVMTADPNVSATVMNGSQKFLLAGGQALKIQPRHERALRAIINR